MVVDVEPVKLGALCGGVFPRETIKDGRDRFAWAAPVGIKVDKNDFAAGELVRSCVLSNRVVDQLNRKHTRASNCSFEANSLTGMMVSVGMFLCCVSSFIPLANPWSSRIVIVRGRLIAQFQTSALVSYVGSFRNLR